MKQFSVYIYTLIEYVFGARHLVFGPSAPVHNELTKSLRRT